MSGTVEIPGRLLAPAFLARLERLSIAARKVQLGTAKGERKSRRKGVSTDFADYREYVQGDDLRHVDWNIYGRLDALHLKMYQDQEDLTVSLLIDASQSMTFGTPSKFAFAQKLAAALGYITLTKYDRLTVEAWGGAGTQRLEPCRGRAVTRKFLAFAEDLQAGGQADLAAGMRTFAARQSKKGVVILISDFLDEAGHEEPLRRLAQCGEAHVVQVLAPEELAPRLTGDLKLVDAETGASAEISVSGALLADYAKRLDEFTDGIRSFCAARGMGYFLVSSATPVESFVMEPLRRGGVLR